MDSRNGERWTVRLRPVTSPNRSGPVGVAARAAVLVALVLTVTAAPVFAAKGGTGKGANATSAAVCTVDGSSVTGYGLPSDEVINFLITDSSGTWGWVLGYSDSGTWTVPVPDRNGATTYEFTGRTSGRDGTKYTVFSSCSA